MLHIEFLILSALQKDLQCRECLTEKHYETSFYFCRKFEVWNTCDNDYLRTDCNRFHAGFLHKIHTDGHATYCVCYPLCFKEQTTTAMW